MCAWSVLGYYLCAERCGGVYVGARRKGPWWKPRCFWFVRKIAVACARLAVRCALVVLSEWCVGWARHRAIISHAAYA